ncbi:MAG: methyltransferase domain-containing protein [Pararhodobacter sp.]|nr:methyltransferase domain-containing protein [Pararhodobacter sp.]MCC5972408.1 methyltransferase domain-containing protein [Pararhodobacter sp.]
MSDIFALFAPLDRAGPGDAASLRWALEVAGTRADARVLDAGCGTGADLPALLAAVPQGRVVAVDMAAPFVARARARFAGVEAHVADMTTPPGGPFDLIWSAGAVYNLGVAAALKAWAGQLAPGGRVAFSDLCWRVAEPPRAAREFWAGEGLELPDAAGLEAQVTAAGWRVLGARWLGHAGWAAYYEPLAARLATFDGDAALTEGFQAEIALWRAYGASYDYRLIVAAPG